MPGKLAARGRELDPMAGSRDRVGGLASHFGRWDDPTLQAKLGLLVLVGVLIALHIASPETRGISLAMLAASLLIVWLGVKLVYG